MVCGANSSASASRHCRSSARGVLVVRPLCPTFVCLFVGCLAVAWMRTRPNQTVCQIHGSECLTCSSATAWARSGLLSAGSFAPLTPNFASMSCPPVWNNWAPAAHTNSNIVAQQLLRVEDDGSCRAWPTQHTPRHGLGSRSPPESRAAACARWMAWAIGCWWPHSSKRAASTALTCCTRA